MASCTHSPNLHSFQPILSSVYGDPVQTVMLSEDSSVQIEAVKKALDVLRDRDPDSEGRALLRSVLCPLYMLCPLKHPLKKLLASGLGRLVSLSPAYSDLVIERLGELLLEGFTSPSDSLRRAATVNCSALMENFSLGQEAVLQRSGHVLDHLVANLESLHQKVSVFVAPQQRSDLLQLSLLSLQVANKLLHRLLEGGTGQGASVGGSHEGTGDEGGGTNRSDRDAEGEEGNGEGGGTNRSDRDAEGEEGNGEGGGTNRSDRDAEGEEGNGEGGGTNRSDRDAEGEEGNGEGGGTYRSDREGTLRKMAEVGITVLKSGSALLDLRCNAGMTIVLVLRSLNGPKLVSMLCRSMFRVASDEDTVLPLHDLSLDDLSLHDLAIHDLASPSLPHLCLLNGLLAMLTTHQLLEDCGKGVFLTDVLGAELQNYIESVTEGPCKLLLSRILVLFVSKCNACLKKEGHPSYNALKQALCGPSPLPACLMQYASDRGEDSLDVIRHQAHTVFRDLLDCHLTATGEDGASSLFLLGLLRSLLAAGLACRRVYAPLSSLVIRMGARTVLRERPTLHREALGQAGEQALATHVADLYLTLAKHDEFPAGKSPDPTCLVTWQRRWVDPVIETLCTGSPQLRKCVLEYFVPRLLKSSPQSVLYIGEKLASDAALGGPSLGALLMCLRQASGVGVVRQAGGDTEQWRGILPWSVLTTALSHRSEQVRVEAFGLLCEHPKSTEGLSRRELDLVLHFLPASFTSQNPAFRQQLLAYCTKLLVRLRDSSRGVRQSKRKQTDKPENSLMYYKEFMTSLCDLLFRYIGPTGGFPSRTTALALLHHLVDTFRDTNKDGYQPSLAVDLTDKRVETLLECLADTFEDNRREAYCILSTQALSDREIGTLSRIRVLLSVGLQLAASTRPQDCTTAAYILRVVTQLPHCRDAIQAGDTSTETTGTGGLPDKSPDSSQASDTERSEAAERSLVEDRSQRPETTEVQQEDCSENCRELRTLLTVGRLLEHLSSQVETAKSSLLHAAATRPLYPALHCVRYLLGNLNLRSPHHLTSWRLTLSRLITISFQVADLVSPVVSSASPEGNVCFDQSILGPGLCLAAPETDAPEAIVAKVNLMPEYLIVCCWRSIKEVSLLLGQLVQTALTGDTSEGSGECGLLNVTQVLAVGDYFSKQLLESVHRGAFELAYAGFSRMTEALWRSPLPALSPLPRTWLTSLLSDLLHSTSDSRFCATRRSAGLPFYIQALVSTETAPRHTLTWTMEQLLPAATGSCDRDGLETDTTVHALNVLRALFRDTRLGEEVSVFVAEGMKAAILGYKSPVWSVRNSASILYSALMTRTFGVKRSREAGSKPHHMTGRAFFTRFPTLFSFLLEELEQATRELGFPGHLHLHPGLYSILMLLGKLCPATMETSTSAMHLSAFIPHVNRCAHSPVHKTRVMAARAVSPLVADTDTIDVMAGLLEGIVGGKASTNYTHGALLQVQHLLPSSGDLSDGLKEGIGTRVLPLVVQTCHLLQHSSCGLVKEVLCQIVFRLLTLLSTSPPSPLHPLHRFLHAVAQEVSTTTFPMGLGAAECYRSFACQYLEYLTSRTLDDLTAVVCDWLKSPHYEVQQVTLEFLSLRESDTRGVNTEQGDETDRKQWTVNRAQEVLQHETIITTLWELLQDTQLYPECIALTLECLAQLETEPLARTNHMTNWLSRLRCLGDNLLDEVRCASLQLMARILSAADPMTQAALVPVVLGLLTERCHADQTVNTRLACVDALLLNTGCLLHNQGATLGSDVFCMWSVLVTLLQDDDVDVRSNMADCLQNFKTDLALPLHPTEPSLVLDWTLQVMVASFRKSQPVGLLSTLFSWLEEELEEWENEEREVRLFDKGDMNTYRDDVTWISLVAKHTQKLIQSLLSPDHSQLENQPHSHNAESCDQPLSDSAESCGRHLVVEYLTNKRTSLADKLEAHQSWVNTPRLGDKFLRPEVCRGDRMCVYRLTTALDVLTGGGGGGGGGVGIGR